MRQLGFRGLSWFWRKGGKIALCVGAGEEGLFHFCLGVLFLHGLFFGFVCSLFGLFGFFPPPPGKVNNLTKVDASSGFGARQLLSALQGVCEEVPFGAIGLQSNTERFDLLD